MGTGSAAARGFTLLEMAATVAVAGVVATTAVPAVGGWIEQQRLKGVAGELASDLQYARSEAVLRGQSVRVSFKGDLHNSACYIVHTGRSDACQCDASGLARCEADAEPIKAVALNAAPGVSLRSNVASVLFAPENGTASPAANLSLSGAQSRSVQHTVNVMGRVRSCSPQGQVAGYRTC